jgi:hypothetical protein
MLDRSEYPNLFDPDRAAAVDDEAQPDSGGEPARPQPRRAAPRVVRPYAPRLAGRVAVHGHGSRRHLVRFAPAVILLALVLVHPVGCGRSTVRPVVAHSVVPTTAAHTTVARIPPRTARAALRRLVAHGPRRRAVRRLTVIARSAPRTAAAVQVASSAPVSVRVRPVVRSVPSEPAPSSPAGAVSRGAGGEFGFER